MGIDVACVQDLDLSGAIVAGDSELAQRAYGRLTTARGTLIDDDSYGILTDAYAGQSGALEVYRIDAESELKREPGAESARVMITEDAGAIAAVRIFVGAIDIAIPLLRGSSSYPVPTLSGVAPNSGSTSSQHLVRIVGTGFADVRAVRFGTFAAAYFGTESDTVLHAVVDIVGVGSSATVDVSVTTPGGTAVLPASYSFVAPVVPVVSTCSPASGDPTVTVPVTLTGSGFTGATLVRFGLDASASFSVVDDFTISAVVATHAGLGAVNVSVTTPAGTGTLIGGYTYTSAAIFDPGTLDLAGWFRSDYAGAPWAGRASVGPSGARSLAAGPAPTIGAAVNGHLPADFDGTTTKLTDSLTGNYFDAANGSLASLFYVRTLTNGSAVPYASPAIFGDVSGNVGIHIGGAANDVMQAYIYSFTAPGGTKVVSVPLTVGGWNFFQMRWNGSLLEARVNGGAWSSIACGNAYTSSGVLVGSGYSNQHIDGLMPELMTSKLTLSDADFNNLLAYCRARYGLALL